MLYNEEYSNTDDLLRIRMRFEATSFWNYLLGNKFTAITEQLELIEIEEEEYPQVYFQINELRVFTLFKKAFHSDSIQDRSAKFGKLKVCTCMHDCEIYTIYEQ